MNAADIEVGIVNSFSCQDIKSFIYNNKIIELERNYGEHSQLPNARRPFVCIGQYGQRSQWAEITRQASQDRLEIKREWRSWQDGDNNHMQTGSNWKNTPQYINGAVFEGPDIIWAQLATEYNSQGKFKIVLTEGITAIRNKLQSELTNQLYDIRQDSLHDGIQTLDSSQNQP